MIPILDYDCPICGKDTPHEHSGLEIHDYRKDQMDAQAYALHQMDEVAHRQIVQYKQRGMHQDKMLANLKKNVESAIASLKRFEESCTFCHGFGGGSHGRLYHGCDREYGFTVNGDTVTCPQCKKCVAYWGGN
jgi:hypothetical protein